LIKKKVCKEKIKASSEKLKFFLHCLKKPSQVGQCFLLNYCDGSLLLLSVLIFAPVSWESFFNNRKISSRISLEAVLFISQKICFNFLLSALNLKAIFPSPFLLQDISV